MRWLSRFWHIIMLNVEPSLFVGRGMDRECYIHPQNRDWCIKITVSGDHKQSFDETKVYSKLLSREISWSNLAKFHGIVETNKGQGLVFDLVRDYDGQVSRSLASYLSEADQSINCSHVYKALDEVKQYLISQKIIVRDLNIDNMLFQKNSGNSGRLVIVDGIGNNELIPLSNYIPWLAVRKIKRKWRRFKNKYRL